jgi:hypothetical protein
VKKQLSEQLNERWSQLCQLAVVEPDSAKLVKVAAEVHLLLDARDAALAAVRRQREATPALDFGRGEWTDGSEPSAFWRAASRAFYFDGNQD